MPYALSAKSLAAALTGFALISCAAVPAPVQALEKPNILIMGEDADRDTVPRSSRIFKRVLDAIANELHNEGFDVFDETATTLDKMAQDRVRRTDAELIGIAKAVQRPPIDVVVVYSIYASSEELAYLTKVRARISGRMINVKSGQRLGAFEVESPKEWTAPKDCNRECILEVVGKYSRVLGQDLGAQISVKLDDMVTGGPSGGLAKKGDIGSAYTIVFQGFAREEIQTFEEYLAVFAGYKNHRPIYAGPRHAEIWYESTAPSARLTRNIGKMLDNEGIRGTVNFSGSEVTVTKLTERKKRAINQSDFQ